MHPRVLNTGVCCNYYDDARSRSMNLTREAWWYILFCDSVNAFHRDKCFDHLVKPQPRISCDYQRAAPKNPRELQIYRGRRLPRFRLSARIASAVTTSILDIPPQINRVIVNNQRTPDAFGVSGIIIGSNSPSSRGLLRRHIVVRAPAYLYALYRHWTICYHKLEQLICVNLVEKTFCNFCFSFSIQMSYLTPMNLFSYRQPKCWIIRVL